MQHIKYILDQRVMVKNSKIYRCGPGRGNDQNVQYVDLICVEGVPGVLRARVDGVDHVGPGGGRLPVLPGAGVYKVPYILIFFLTPTLFNSRFSSQKFPAPSPLYILPNSLNIIGLLLL